MIIKEEEYKVCSECYHRTFVRDAVHVCDGCKKIEIDLNNTKTSYLEISVHKEYDHDRFYFCSWGCVVTFLKTFKRPKHFRFLTLPYVSDYGKGKDFKSFMSYIKEL